VVLIHEHSRGIPRTISVMCDNALLTGFGLGRQSVDSAVVLEVAHDFDLGGPGLPEAPAPLVHTDLGPTSPDQPEIVATEALEPEAPADTVGNDERRMFASAVSKRPSRFSLFARTRN
jgi:hypothetical protein